MIGNILVRTVIPYLCCRLIVHQPPTSILLQFPPKSLTHSTPPAAPPLSCYCPNQTQILFRQPRHRHGIPFDIFYQINEETCKNATEIGAKNSQTGPAKRRDNKTINKHLDLLSDEGIKKIYLDLTNSIKKIHE